VSIVQTRAASVTAAPQVEAQVSALYVRYRLPLYRYCRAQLRSHDEAEDAVQSTFLRVFTALRNGIEPECETAWLYKIAHNVCLSRRLGAMRRARVERPHDLQDLEDRLAAPERGGQEELGDLNDALAQMPENLRRVILLREWQGLSYAEIAEVLEVSISAVETLIFRGRRHLVKALSGASETTESRQFAAACA
jgi:RNA polymerase sigma factor (sigma-70 family)